MIVTDLDGTLLRDDKTISDRTISTIKQCRGRGVKLIYATGRGDSAKILAPSELFDGFVRMNGAVAYIDEKLIYSRLISIDKVRNLLVAADKAGIKIAAEYNGHYANFNVHEIWPWISSDTEIVDFNKLSIKNAEKLYAVMEKPQDIELITRYLPDDLYFHVGREKLAMIMHREGTKSKATAAVAEYWGIKQNETAAFGDDVNDIDLLQYCGTGIAVANALDEVKAAADQICESNENDGVAKWLENNVC